jgi:hypothetical protein
LKDKIRLNFQKLQRAKPRRRVPFEKKPKETNTVPVSELGIHEAAGDDDDDAHAHATEMLL